MKRRRFFAAVSAKAVVIAIPEATLLRADEVIR